MTSFSFYMVCHPGLGVIFPSPSIGLGSRDELSSVVHDFADKETESQRGWRSVQGRMGYPSRNPGSWVFNELPTQPGH